jgi:17beta-estradiol 17-dehydrogenase / very-long-chain 3-oxoacyl-CoA reductase
MESNAESKSPASLPDKSKGKRSTNNALGLDPKVYNLLKFIIFNMCLPIAALSYLYKYLSNSGLLADLADRGIFHGSKIELIGLVFTIVTLYKTWLLVYRGFIIRGKKPESYGKWAIITGSTSGIGASFVEELSRRKMSLLLVSRDEEKLAKQKASLAGIEVKYLVYDFTVYGEAKDAFYKTLDETCKELHNDGGIGLLVNNVGIANPNDDIPLYLEEFTPSQCDNLIKCNIFSVVNMTHTVLKYMKERKSGCVLNISSGSGNFPGPMLAIYSATKAFMTQFSNSMHVECWGSGVDFLVVTPFYIVSNLVKRKSGTILIPMPSVFVKGVLRILGRGKYFWQSYGYWFHGVIGFIADYYWDITARNRDMMLKNRARADERKKQKTN